MTGAGAMDRLLPTSASPIAAPDVILEIVLEEPVIYTM